jgi:hypothetical protein
VDASSGDMEYETGDCPGSALNWILPIGMCSCREYSSELIPGLMYPPYAV